MVGYPEKVDVSENWPTSPEYYNSSIIVNADGEIAGGYRKSHLYTVDETWALEGQDGFFCGDIAGVENVTLGISTDLAFVTLYRRPIQPSSLNMLLRVISSLTNTLLHSPYRFRSAFTDHEFAFHVLNCHSNLVIVSLAWPTSQDAHFFRQAPREPDMETLMYWMARLGPIIHRQTDEETIVVFANRTGIDGKITYAGTSAVLGIRDGEVNVYGILGRSDREVLVVDTNQEPLGKLVYRQDGPFVHGQTSYSTEEHPKLEPSPPPPPPPPARPPRASSQTIPGTPNLAKASPTVESTWTRVKTKGGHEQNQARTKVNPMNDKDTTPQKRAREIPKLSLNTGPAVTGRSMLSGIPTSICPIPTPISPRALFSIPPAETWTNRYIDDQHVVPTPHPNVFTPSQATAAGHILGGEVIIASAVSIDEGRGRFFNWEMDNAPIHAPHSPPHSPTQPAARSDFSHFSGFSPMPAGGRSGHPASYYQRVEPARGSNFGPRPSTFGKLQETREVILPVRTMGTATPPPALIPSNKPSRSGSPNSRPRDGTASVSSSRLGTSSTREPARTATALSSISLPHNLSPAPKSAEGGEESRDRPRCPEHSSFGRPRHQGASYDGTPREPERTGSVSVETDGRESIDLTQFRVIEEYNTDKCPVHRSRSTLRTHGPVKRSPAANPQRNRSPSALGQKASTQGAATEPVSSKAAEPGIQKPNNPANLPRKKSGRSFAASQRPSSVLEVHCSGLTSVNGANSRVEHGGSGPTRSASTFPLSPTEQRVRSRWVDDRLAVLSNSVPPIIPPPSNQDFGINFKEPATPKAMFIMYDSSGGDDDAVLANQTIHCIAQVRPSAISI